MPEPQLSPWQQRLLPQNASVFDPSWLKTVRALAHVMGIDDPVTAIMGAGAPTPDPNEGGAVGYLAQRFPKFAEAIGIKAYHGSPHDFEQFSTAKIGTGEGAQAYGHGLYFAENQDVARSYRTVQAPAYQNAGVHAIVHDAMKDAAAEGLSGSDARQWARTDIMRQAIQRPTYARQQWFDAANNLDAVLDTPPGKMYEVAIKAHPDQFLDWDKPLSQQSEHVQKAVGQLVGNVQPVKLRDGWYSVTRVAPDGSGTVLTSQIKESTPEAAMHSFQQWILEGQGSNFYHLVGSENRGPGATSGSAIAAEKMRDAGIAGIKYLDQGSRAAGEGSSNYVVFDDKLVDILRKYGLLLPLAGGAGAAQQGQQ